MTKNRAQLAVPHFAKLSEYILYAHEEPMKEFEQKS